MSQRSAKTIRRLESIESQVEFLERVVDGQQEMADSLTQQRNHERRRAKRMERAAHTWRKAAYTMAAASIAVELIAIAAIQAKGVDNEIAQVSSIAQPVRVISEISVQEDYENEKIQAALLERANVIPNCTITWYTEATCGKTPDDPAYGITRSGLPVVEYLTCAVDPKVIPLYSDVFVEYADGTIEQLWATDTGVKGKALDIYTPDYDYAIQCGRQKLTVYWIPPEEGN